MISNFPLISVIVPVYNTAPYLRQCLDSICNQTYQNLEIICVNDGSTDNSAEILEEYAAKDSRIIVITQANAGQSVARNVAIDRANGEWIASVDSDDWIEPDTYEYFVSHIGNSTAKVAVIGLEMVKMPQRQVLWTYVMTRGKEGEIELTPELLQKAPNVFWNKIWKSSFIKESQVRFPAGMWAGEDVVFISCLLPYIDKVLNLPQIKYHYVRYEKGTSIMDQMKHSSKALDIILPAEKVFQYQKEHPFPPNMQAYKGLFLLQRYMKLLRDFNSTPATQQKAWDILKRLVDEYNLLPSDEIANSELLLQYHTPPCTYAAIKTLRNQVTQLKRHLNLTHQYSRLLRSYRITQFKLLFSWGARRRKYEERKQRIKQLIREYRGMRYKSRRELQW